LEEYMSEAKGSFNSAIGVLQKELRYWPDWRERFDSCQAAIRVLEAAGKVDKERLADGLEELWGVYMDERGTYGDMKKIVGDLDALLEALPDKEGK
jgi:hypothetical protein